MTLLRLPPDVRVYAAFAVYAFCLGSIFPRLPDIQTAMGVGEGALGLGLIGAPVGTLIALTFATPILEKIGFRRALLIANPLMTIGYAVSVHATGPLAFFLLLVPTGLMIGSIEVLLNVEADRTEHLIGRRIMNRAHSFWSFGFFGAGLFGGAIAQLGISPQLHLALIVPASLVGTLLIYGDYKPSPERANGNSDAAPRVAWPNGAIMVLVVVTFGAMLMEGASIDWAAIYMRDIFQSSPFIAGFAVAVFALSQATTRFFADRFVEKHSPSGVARTLFGVLAVGIMLLLVTATPLLSLIGFALIGIGTSAIFPLAMSAAAQRTDRPAAINVAALAQFSFIVFLLGPPLLGFVAEHFGIAWTYGFGLPLILVSFLMAGALGEKPAPKAQTREAEERAS